MKVEDDSTVPNPRDQYYWNKYLNGKGFDKFEGLDVEKVKKMEIWKGEFAGKDAVAGATMSSEAIQKVNAIIKEWSCGVAERMNSLKTHPFILMMCYNKSILTGKFVNTPPLKKASFPSGRCTSR